MKFFWISVVVACALAACNNSETKTGSTVTDLANGKNTSAAAPATTDSGKLNNTANDTSRMYNRGTHNMHDSLNHK